MSLPAELDRKEVARASARVGAAVKKVRIAKGLTQAKASELGGLEVRF